VPAYETADVRFGRHLSPGLDLSVVGQNLLQPHHAEFGIDPGPNVEIKRGVYAKLVWTRNRGAGAEGQFFWGLMRPD
jgi:iron complex outermembrane receptor protein